MAGAMCVGTVADIIVSCAIVYVYSSVGSRLSNFVLSGGSSICIPFSMSSGLLSRCLLSNLWAWPVQGLSRVCGASHAFRLPVVCGARPVCPCPCAVPFLAECESTIVELYRPMSFCVLFLGAVSWPAAWTVVILVVRPITAVTRRRLSFVRYEHPVTSCGQV